MLEQHTATLKAFVTCHGKPMGASEIARFMGVSPDYVRKLAKSRSCPIRDVEGRYFCTKREIVVWLGINNRN